MKQRRLSPFSTLSPNTGPVGHFNIKGCIFSNNGVIFKGLSPKDSPAADAVKRILLKTNGLFKQRGNLVAKR